MVAWLRAWLSSKPLEIRMSFYGTPGPVEAIMEKRPDSGSWLGCCMFQHGRVLEFGYSGANGCLKVCNRSSWWLMRRMQSLMVGVDVIPPRDGDVGSVVVMVRYKRSRWWKRVIEQYSLTVPFDQLKHKPSRRKYPTIHLAGTMTRDKIEQEVQDG